MTERVPLSEYLASLPHEVGYQLDERHVAAAAVSADGRPGPLAAVQWDTSVASDRALAEEVAATLARVARNSGYERFLIVGYGPDGAERAGLLSDALLATADLPEPLRVHVDHDTWRVQLPGSEQWSPAQPLPDLSAAAVLEGTPLPASSREELAHRFDPLPEPLYGDVAARDAALFADSAPSFRADVAVRSLHHLAVPGQSDDRDRMATLAHLTAAGPAAVRDAVLVAAADDPARTDALVRTYRAAPEQHRPALATTAAAAVYLGGGQSPAIEAILRHADREGPNAALTRLVEAAKNQGINPHKIRRAIGSSIATQLDEADARWHQSRSSAVRSASFPTTARSVGADAAAAAYRPAPGGRSTGPEVER